VPFTKQDGNERWTAKRGERLSKKNTSSCSTVGGGGPKLPPPKTKEKTKRANTYWESQNSVGQDAFKKVQVGSNRATTVVQKLAGTETTLVVSKKGE